jgi:hypothetical protein
MAAAPGALSGDLRTAAANLVLLGEAEGIARLLDDAAIPAIFLKGIALLDDAYSDVAERPMDDIDILIAPRGLERAVEAIRRVGFETCGNAMLARKQSGTFPVQIDLHHELWCFAGSAFWARSRTKPVAGSRLRVLAREDQLLHAIFHGVVQDGEVSARALDDCRRIVEGRGEPFGWERFLDTVRREGWERPVGWFLQEYHRFHPGPLPPEARSLMASAPPRPAKLNALQPYRRILALQSRPARRLVLLWKLLFPPSGFLRLRYSWMPRPLAFLLPLLRPLLLGWAAGAGIAKPACRISSDS